MTPVLKAFWDALDDTVRYHQKNDDAVILNHDKFDSFKALATELYNSIKNTYMKPTVDTLDRHKVAAVMIVSAIKCKAVEYSKPLQENTVFLGCEMFATEVALTWMLESMNEKLRDSGAEIQISEYYMPEAFACSTPYFEIFSRNLFFAQKHYHLNPLDIAEKLFLLEFITVIKNGVSPSLLHEGQ